MQATHKLTITWVDTQHNPGHALPSLGDWVDALDTLHHYGSGAVRNVQIIEHTVIPQPMLDELVREADLILMNTHRVEHILILPNGAVELAIGGCAALTFPPQLVPMTGNSVDAKDDRGAGYALEFFDRRSI